MSRWKIAMTAPSFSTPLAVVTEAQLKVFTRTVVQTFVHMKSDTPDPNPCLLRSARTQVKVQRDDRSNRTSRIAIKSDIMRVETVMTLAVLDKV